MNDSLIVLLTLRDDNQLTLIDELVELEQEDLAELLISTVAAISVLTGLSPTQVAELIEDGTFPLNRIRKHGWRTKNGKIVGPPTDWKKEKEQEQP